MSTILDRIERNAAKALLLDEIRKTEAYKYVSQVITDNKKVIDREKALGFGNIEEKAMGSGGVGQIKIISGFVYMQLAYGHSRSNYASVVKLGHIQTSENGKKSFIESSLFSLI